MPASRAIECFGDLPAKWQRAWQRCSAAYIDYFHGRRSKAWAELAAFEDIKKCYLNEMAAAPAATMKSPAD